MLENAKQELQLTVACGQKTRSFTELNGLTGRFISQF